MKSTAPSNWPLIIYRCLPLLLAPPTPPPQATGLVATASSSCWTVAQAPGTPATAQQGGAAAAGHLRRRQALLRDPPLRLGGHGHLDEARVLNAGALPGRCLNVAQCAPGVTDHYRIAHHHPAPTCHGRILASGTCISSRAAPGPGQLRAGQPTRQMSFPGWGPAGAQACAPETGTDSGQLRPPAIAPGAAKTGASSGSAAARLRLKGQAR